MGGLDNGMDGHAERCPSFTKSASREADNAFRNTLDYPSAADAYRLFPSERFASPDGALGAERL
jgi:hypothetical protein